MSKAKQDVLIREIINPKTGEKVPGLFEALIGKRIPDLQGGPEALMQTLSRIDGINGIMPPDKMYQIVFEVAANFDAPEVVAEVEAALKPLVSDIQIVNNQRIITSPFKNV